MHGVSSKSETNKGSFFPSAHPSDVAHKDSNPPLFFLLIQLGLCFGAFSCISHRSANTGFWLFSDKMVTRYDSKHEKFQAKCQAQELAKSPPARPEDAGHGARLVLLVQNRCKA